MATKMSDIGDILLSNISDYKIITLFQTSGSDAVDSYLENWLLRSVDRFSGICDQTLSYSKSTKQFSLDLSQKNQNVLAAIMEEYWLNKEVQNVLQMNNHIVDKDFKTFSAAQNLKEKINLLNAKKEDVDQILIRYNLENGIDWTSWQNQDFYP